MGKMGISTEDLQLITTCYSTKDNAFRYVSYNGLKKFGQIPTNTMGFQEDHYLKSNIIDDIKSKYGDCIESLTKNFYLKKDKDVFISKKMYEIIQVGKCFISYYLNTTKNDIFRKTGKDTYSEIIESIRIYFYDDTDQMLLDDVKDILTSNLIKVAKVPTHVSIGYIVMSQSGPAIYNTSIRRKFDIKEFDKSSVYCYGKDFPDFHKSFMNKLITSDKGLVLFHGDTGTGKSFYIRRVLYELADKEDAQILMVSPNQFNYLLDPSFLKSFIAWCNDSSISIILIEDAEALLESREETRTSGISNLLNMADGILSDLLQSLKIICTFNTPVSKIDSALVRKERLLAIKNFEKINSTDAKALGKYLGIEKQVDEMISTSVCLDEKFKVSISDIFAIKNDNAELSDINKVRPKKRRIGFYIPTETPRLDIKKEDDIDGMCMDE